MNGDEDNNSKVGFRDIYRAVGESEARLTLLIQTTLGPISVQMIDHEKRIRDIEQSGSSEAQEAVRNAATLALRVGVVESLVNSRSSREMGVITTLGAQRTFLILIASTIAGVAALLDLIGRLTPQ